LLYGIIAPVKNKVSIVSILSFLDHLNDPKYHYEFDLRSFHEPPDSMVGYIAGIKFYIALKTLLIMLSLGGICDFIVCYIKKYAYIIHQRPSKLFGFKHMLKIAGLFMFTYYFLKELKISPIYDSTLIKLRIMISYVFVMLISNLLIPIQSYKSMFRTEFLIINWFFLSYTMTYPSAYFVLLHLVYEVAVLVSFYLLI
jgi:hypothetical protein